MVGDKVYLKVSPTKGEVKFWSTRKLKSRYIWPFDIIGRVGDVIDELALPPNLEWVHNVFHVSVLKTYVIDESHTIPNYSKYQLWGKTTEDTRSAKLGVQNKSSALVKVLWNNQCDEKASCMEKGVDMQKEIPPNCLKTKPEVISCSHILLFTFMLEDGKS